MRVGEGYAPHSIPEIQPSSHDVLLIGAVQRWVEVINQAAYTPSATNQKQLVAMQQQVDLLNGMQFTDHAIRQATIITIRDAIEAPAARGIMNAAYNGTVLLGQLDRTLQSNTVRDEVRNRHEMLSQNAARPANVYETIDAIAEAFGVRHQQSTPRASPLQKAGKSPSDPISRRRQVVMTSLLTGALITSATPAVASGHGSSESPSAGRSERSSGIASLMHKSAQFIGESTETVIDSVASSAQSAKKHTLETVTGKPQDYSKITTLPQPARQIAEAPVVQPNNLTNGADLNRLLDGARKLRQLDPDAPEQAQPDATLTYAKVVQAAKQPDSDALLTELKTHVENIGLRRNGSETLRKGVTRITDGIHLERVEHDAGTAKGTAEANTSVVLANLASEFDGVLTSDDPILRKLVVGHLSRLKATETGTRDMQPYYSQQIAMLNGGASLEQGGPLNELETKDVAFLLADARNRIDTISSTEQDTRAISAFGGAEPVQAGKLISEPKADAPQPQTRPRQAQEDENGGRMTRAEASKRALNKMESMGPQWRNRARSMRYLMDHGIKEDYQAAGSIGNWCVEGGNGCELNPKAQQVGGPGRTFLQVGNDTSQKLDRYGYFGKQENSFLWYADQHNLDPEELDTVLGFFLWELDNSERAAGKLLHQAGNVRQATDAIMKYERPGVPHYDRRLKYSNETLNVYRKLVASELKQDAREHKANQKKAQKAERYEPGNRIRSRLKREHHGISGKLSSKELQTIGGAWGGHQLYPAAAQTFRLMADAFEKDFGRKLEITDSYRSFDAQVACRREKGSLCADPGTSQHGWGLAVDFASNINSLGTPEHRWMQENARKFGWHHPGWAEPGGKKPEAWHWEYLGGKVVKQQARKQLAPQRKQEVRPTQSQYEGGPLSRKGYTTPVDPALYAQTISKGTPYNGYKHISGVHTGVDISVKYVPFRAVKNGIVIHVGEIGAGIHAIEVKQSDGLYAVYQHITPGSSKVTVGQKVDTGQHLGKTGNSGDPGVTTGAHLHISIQTQKGIASKNDPNVFAETNNPMDYLPSKAETEAWLKQSGNKHQQRADRQAHSKRKFVKRIIRQKPQNQAPTPSPSPTPTQSPTPAAPSDGITVSPGTPGMDQLLQESTTPTQ